VLLVMMMMMNDSDSDDYYDGVNHRDSMYSLNAYYDSPTRK
jgi:hypothetical protein